MLLATRTEKVHSLLLYTNTPVLVPAKSEQLTKLYIAKEQEQYYLRENIKNSYSLLYILFWSKFVLCTY